MRILRARPLDCPATIPTGSGGWLAPATAPGPTTGRAIPVCSPAAPDPNPSGEETPWPGLPILGSPGGRGPAAGPEAAGHDMALVVSRADTRRGRGSQMSPSPVKKARSTSDCRE